MGSHGCGPVTKCFGSLEDAVGSSWTRLELNTVATRVAGRYSVATEVNAFIAFESLSLCSPSRVRILACSPKRTKFWDMAVLVLSMCLLVRKSRILCSCQVDSESVRQNIMRQSMIWTVQRDVMFTSSADRCAWSPSLRMLSFWNSNSLMKLRTSVMEACTFKPSRLSCQRSSQVFNTAMLPSIAGTVCASFH